MKDDVSYTDSRGRVRADLVGQFWDEAMEGLTPEKFLADLKKYNPRIEFGDSSALPVEKQTRTRSKSRAKGKSA